MQSIKQGLVLLSALVGMAVLMLVLCFALPVLLGILALLLMFYLAAGWIFEAARRVLEPWRR